MPTTLNLEDEAKALGLSEVTEGPDLESAALDLGLKEVVPDSAVGSFIRGAKAKAASGVGGLLGALTGGAGAGLLGLPSGPGAVAASVLGATAGAAGGSALGEKFYRSLMGEQAMNEEQAQLESNRAAHSVAASTGEMLPALLPAAASPTRAAGAVGRVAHAVESGLSIGAAGEAARQVESGEFDPAAMVVHPIEEAIKFGPVGLIPHASGILGKIAKGIPDAAVMTLSSQLYDNLVHDKPMSFSGYATETGESIPSFLLLNAVSSALHAPVNALRSVKPKQAVQSTEDIPERVVVPDAGQEYKTGETINRDGLNYRVSSVRATTENGVTRREASLVPVQIEMVDGKPIDISGLALLDKEIKLGEGNPVEVTEPLPTEPNPAEPRPIEAIHQRDKFIRELSNDELKESLTQAEVLGENPEWQEVIDRLKAEADRRANQKLTNRQEFQDDGLPKDELQVPEVTPIIPNLPELRTEGGFKEPLSGAELSAQVFENAAAPEERLRQSPEGARALAEDLALREAQSREIAKQGIEGLEGMYNRTPEGWMHNIEPPRPTSEQMNLFLEEEFLRRNPGQKTILPKVATDAPAKAISSPSEASSPKSATATLPEAKSAPEAKETPKKALPEREALDAIAQAEHDLKTAQDMRLSPSIIQHLRNRLTAAQKAKMEVDMPDGSKAEAPVIVKGADGKVEVNEAPAAFVAAEAAKVENARLAAEKAKLEAEKEKAALQSTESPKATKVAATNVESREEPDHDHAIRQLKGKKVSLTKLEDGEEVTKKGLDAQDEYRKNLKREEWLSKLLTCLKS